MKILSLSNLCFVLALAIGLAAAWSVAAPGEISGARSIGGLGCTYCGAFYPCQGTDGLCVGGGVVVSCYQGGSPDKWCDFDGSLNRCFGSGCNFATYSCWMRDVD